MCLVGAAPLMAQDDSGCSTPTDTVSEPDKAGEGGGEERRPKAQLGDSLTLEGQDSKLQVTTLKVLDPAPAGEFDTPTGGQRYVGIQVALRNVGEKTYIDAPSNGGTLILEDDSQAQSALLSDGACSLGFATDVKISPGSQQQGCLPFEVPGKVNVKTFQFTLDSGFGGQSGEWRLPVPPPAIIDEQGSAKRERPERMP